MIVAPLLVDDSLLAIAVAGIGLSFIGLVAMRKPTPGTTDNATVKAPTTLGRSGRSCPAGYVPVLPPHDLFKQVAAHPLLVRITQGLGFAPENFSRDVQPLLDQVADFVQLLPASESHHHAHPGGLLTHLLEVSAIALLRAEEAKLPIGRPTEQQLKFAARWRYGVLVAALLHDVGKPIADVIVDVLDQRGATSVWTGLGGTLGEYGEYYKVRFPLKHDYKAHQRLPVMLLKSMVPGSTMRWLSDDPELVRTLIDYLAGESDGGIIGQLVMAADRKSVGDNLLAGPRTRFSSARQVPLVERLMDGLRRLLESGEIALNRDGAMGFCDGTDVWFVAGVLADRVRTYLDQAELREEGAAGIPTDNSRLFDVFLDYGAVVPNGPNAIWRARVTLEKAGGETWSQVFTLLRFPLLKLFAEPASYPSPLAGRIEIVATTHHEAAPAVALPTPAAVPALPSGDAGLAPAPAAPGATRAPSVPDQPQPAQAGDDELAATPIDFDAALPSADYLDADESAEALSVPMLPTPKPASTGNAPRSNELSAPVVPAQARVPEDSVVPTGKGPAPEIEQLMGWIQQGVATGDITYNRANASVQFVREGMLLITPKIFRQYLNSLGTPVDGDRNGAAVKHLQKLLQKSGYVGLARPNSYLHTYRVSNAKNPARDMVTGYLVTRPELFFNPVPPVNDVLARPGGHEGADK